MNAAVKTRPIFGIGHVLVCQHCECDLPVRYTGGAKPIELSYWRDYIPYCSKRCADLDQPLQGSGERE